MTAKGTRELLLEIGCEEIPARFIPGALEALEKKAAGAMTALRLDHGEIVTAGTPRRLTICLREVSPMQPDLSQEVTGPAKSVAYGADGKLTRAGEGFARSQGVEPGELTVKSLPKGEYVCAVRKEAGRPAGDILREEIPGWITSLRFPKSMRWGDGDLRFARPIHWILALFGGEVLDFEVEGISSGRESRGHRFLSPGAFEVAGWEDYLEKARASMVVADPEERRSSIARQIAEAASGQGGEVSEDEGLLETVTHLVEYPTAVCGSFDEDFLNLPDEVLITSMKSHQKYFTVRDDQGRLMARFIAVSNMICDDGMKLVRQGNERVLRARLADARFFFREDSKVPLGERVKELAKVVYQEKIGSYHEKTERVSGLAGELAAKITLTDPADAARAALLGKADLVTQMVGEFPELQGVMGREYALLSGEKPAVAKAIYEQYLPRFSGDVLPESDLGAILSIADRADSIVGIFGIGEAPTGSEDPYGMRRHTLAIISILTEKEYPIELNLLFEKAICHLQGTVDRSAPELFGEIMDFFKGRLENNYIAAGHAPDVVKAVLAAGFRLLPEVRAKIAALDDFRKEEDFPLLAAAFKRAANIVPRGFHGEVDESLFSEKEEKDLYEALSGIEGEAARLMEEGDYRGALRKMAAVRPVLDSFFDGVLVMAEERGVRNNRLALVQRLASLISGVADFRQLTV